MLLVSVPYLKAQNFSCLPCLLMVTCTWFFSYSLHVINLVTAHTSCLQHFCCSHWIPWQFILLKSSVMIFLLILQHQ